MSLKFEESSPGHWTCRHHGLLGMVTEIDGGAIWGVAMNATDTAKWDRANTIRGAKRACGQVLREGRFWKERRKQETKVLLAGFRRLAGEIEASTTHKGPPMSVQDVYRMCNNMRRIWLELERRGVQPEWPDGATTRHFLTI